MDVTEAERLIDYTTHSLTSEEAPSVGSVIPVLATVIPIDYSDGYGDTEQLIGELGELHKIAPGEEPAEDSFQDLWIKPVRFDEFGAKVKITKRDYEAIEGAAKLTNMVQRIVSSFQTNWMSQKEEAFVELYNKGPLSAGHEAFNATHKGYADSTGDKIYDSQQWFSTAHPLGYDSGTTLSNYNSSRAFSAANLATTRREFKKDIALTDRNRRIQHMPTHVFAPTELEDSVLTVLNSRLLPGGGNNDVNTNYQSLQPLFSPFLDDTDGWFLCRAGFGVDFFDSGNLIPRVYVEQTTESIVIEVKGLYGRRIRDWRHAIANNIAAA